MVHDDPWRRAVQEAARRAAEIPWIKVGKLAEAAGWTPQAFWNFRQYGHGDYRKVRQLEQLFAVLGLMDSSVNKIEESAVQSYQSVRDPSSILAEHLRALASILESPHFDTTTKSIMFLSAIESLTSIATSINSPTQDHE